MRDPLPRRASSRYRQLLEKIESRLWFDIERVLVIRTRGRPPGFSIDVQPYFTEGDKGPMTIRYVLRWRDREGKPAEVEIERVGSPPEYVRFQEKQRIQDRRDTAGD